MNTVDPVLRPVTDDPDTAAFFAAAAEGRLVVQACEDCGLVLHLPTGFCPQCRSRVTTWREVGGTGTLHSWTVVEHQVHPAMPVPYTSVLVDLDELPGVRFLGRLDGRPKLTIGMAMTVEFVDAGGVRIPNWVPAGSGDRS